MKKNFVNCSDLEIIIAQRLNLNTNQRILANEFNLPFANINSVKDKNYLKQNFLYWEEPKRNKFIQTLGGRINFDATKKLINNLITQ